VLSIQELALRAGAPGYLLKSLIRTELLETIRAVHADRRCIAPEIVAQIADHVADNALTGSQRSLVSPRKTVKAYVKSILSKLGANGRTHAVTIALRRGIIEI